MKDRLVISGLKRPGLQPTSLRLIAGETVCIAGASGAGKTLLLRAIADLDVNEGDLRLDGTRREDIAAPTWRNRVAFVPAESGWWATIVADHFPSPLPDTVSQLGFPTDVASWPISRLSTGERQRLALARSLALGPDVLLLDEPTSGLDPASTAKVESLLQEALAQGAAAIVVTHDAAQAARLGARRFQMTDGKLHEGAT